MSKLEKIKQWLEPIIITKFVERYWNIEYKYLLNILNWKEKYNKSFENKITKMMLDFQDDQFEKLQEICKK